MCSGPTVLRNLSVVEAAIEQAPELDVLLLPENFAQMPASRRALHVENEGGGLVQETLSELAGRYQIHIVAGSLAVRPNKDSKPFARCLVYGAGGEEVAHYDKLHLFDVDTGSDKNQRYRESETYQAGALSQAQPSPVSLNIDQTPLLLGLTICYDLRFPELYRALAANGAQLISVPSAFTFETGQAHWEALLRARAIENQVFIAAPAQSGRHANGRQTWGHSMIIDPWGDIIVQQKMDEGLVFADIDLTQIESLKARFPVDQHSRLPRN